MKTKQLTIQTPKGKRVIGSGNPTFIVAEISCNHRQKHNEAVKLVQAAAKAGADAVKFQTYTPDTMTIDSDKSWFVIGGDKNPDSWKKLTFFDIYRKAYTPWDWQPKLKKLAEKLGMVFFSSPFDATAVDFLKKLNVPCYKIASYEATDIPLLKKVAKTKKPVIVSVGFASQKETAEAISTLRKYGSGEIAVLHCLTSYAEQPENAQAHLHTIADIRDRFGVVPGFSDNNGGIKLPVMAVLAGACIVEKHLNLSHHNDSLDVRFSVIPEEFAVMVKKIRQAEKVLGTVHYGPNNDAEKHNRNFRRSIFVTRDIKNGDKFTKENIRVIRPAYGLAPKYYEKVIGKRASQSIERGEPLSWKMVGK